MKNQSLNLTSLGTIMCPSFYHFIICVISIKLVAGLETGVDVSRFESGEKLNNEKDHFTTVVS